MASEDGTHHGQHGLPLESIDLPAVPLSTHNLSWSPDLELAIGTDDSVFLFVPEFPSRGTTAAPGAPELHRQYSEVALQFPVIELRLPELNQALFTAVGQELPPFQPSYGAGKGVVTGLGGSLNHVVSLEWSPPGLGRSKRSVLGVLTGSGALNIYGDAFTDGIRTSKLKGRNVRAIRSWVVAWGVGGNLVVPRAANHESGFSKENITSFAWAREIEGKGALLAYANDEDEVAILSVQSQHHSSGQEGDVGDWRVEEVARFDVAGPHPKGDPADPDFSPCGSSFSLRWSPWLKHGTSRTAILSYVTKNYVGFRRITMSNAWKHMKPPRVEVAESDCSGICLYLAPDAFVTWEDLVWTIGGAKACRGLIATPAKVRAFQVALNGAPEDPISEHATELCDTTYPPEDEMDDASNPITGLVIHPPNLSQSTTSPYFSAARLSATPGSTTWQQTNLPLPSNPEEPSPKPRWATEILKYLETKQPITTAYTSADPFGTATVGDGDGPGNGMEDGDEESDEGDDEHDEHDEHDEQESDDDDEEELDKDAFLGQMADLQNTEKVHTTRLRILGMASSPGGGVVAVFAVLHHALRPGRLTFRGLRCKVLFGRSLAPVDADLARMKNLSTEARTWEWMYGGGAAVPGAVGGGKDRDDNDAAAAADQDGKHNKAVKAKFAPVAAEQTCVFCDAGLEPRGGGGRASACERGHVFQNCAATGLPILAPGISHTCAVCGRKSLTAAHLLDTAGYLKAFIEKEISDVYCGGCGGKFI